MYITQPFSLTQMYIEQDSTENKYKGLLTANFQDYMDSMKQTSELQLRSGKLKQQIASLTSAIGLAAGSTLAGPAGMALGFSIGNTLGKYFGNVVSERIYGQAIADVSEISHDSKLRHSQLAATVAFLNQLGGAVDTFRQNENKRKKDDLQAMQV